MQVYFTVLGIALGVMIVAGWLLYRYGLFGEDEKCPKK